SLTTERPGRGASRDLRRSSMPPHAAPRASRRRWRGIEASPRKEVVLFVHGYANAFQDAAFSMADLCHFFGREFVCAIFTWPAGGSRGMMAGYNVDRESGEFAVQHLKQTIRLIAQTPGVKHIHLMAHSRGTDVLASALREMNIESYAGGASISDRFKLKNIVLLAPDIDADVAAAKIFGVVSDPDADNTEELRDS